ncbi:hypothetical protein [Halorubrum gandharaense]
MAGIRFEHSGSLQHRQGERTAATEAVVDNETTDHGDDHATDHGDASARGRPRPPAAVIRATTFIGVPVAD